MKLKAKQDVADGVCNDKCTWTGQLLQKDINDRLTRKRQKQ